MSQAIVLEVRGATAGLLVGTAKSFRFYSSRVPFDELDGRHFASVAEAQRAVNAQRHSRAWRSAA